MATGRIGTTPVLTTRWSKAPSNGTTSLSGLDDNSVSLVYSVGFEQVYRNGVLLSRGNDYTATTGTSITLTDATITGDIIEVFANATVALTDTYTQSQANGKFINNTLTTTTGDIIYASAANTPARLGIGSTSQVLTVSGGVPSWATPTTTFVGCRIYNSTDFASNSGASVKLTFNSEDIDTDAFHSTSSNTSRITIPSGKGGKYLFTMSIGWSQLVGTTTGQRNAYLIKNGSTYLGGGLIVGNGNSPAWVNGSYIVDAVAGDYFEVEIYQDSGNNATAVRGGTLYNNFCCEFLGA